MTFLNKKQIENLKKKDWDVVPDCAFINLYADDFESGRIWEQVCDQLKISSNSEEVTVLYVAVKS